MEYFNTILICIFIANGYKHGVLGQSAPENGYLYRLYCYGDVSGGLIDAEKQCLVGRFWAAPDYDNTSIVMMDKCTSTISRNWWKVVMPAPGYQDPNAYWLKNNVTGRCLTVGDESSLNTYGLGNDTPLYQYPCVENAPNQIFKNHELYAPFIWSWAYYSIKGIGSEKCITASNYTETRGPYDYACDWNNKKQFFAFWSESSKEQNPA